MHRTVDTKKMATPAVAVTLPKVVSSNEYSHDHSHFFFSNFQKPCPLYISPWIFLAVFFKMCSVLNLPSAKYSHAVLLWPISCLWTWKIFTSQLHLKLYFKIFSKRTCIRFFSKFTLFKNPTNLSNIIYFIFTRLELIFFPFYSQLKIFVFAIFVILHPNSMGPTSLIHFFFIRGHLESGNNVKSGMFRPCC